MPNLPLSHLRQIAKSENLHLIGAAKVNSLEIDADRLRAWQENGYSGEMQYMQRDPELLSQPLRINSAAATVVMFGAFYDQGRSTDCPIGFGRVARYAWGQDYHKVIRESLHRVCAEVERSVGSPIKARVFTDSVPLLERALAREAGLGFIGKNTMLIVPGRGSFLFLAEILWDLHIDDDENSKGLAEPTVGCGSCQRCINNCPTGAFVSAHVLDARRCISYLTIEKRGALSIQERKWVGEWIFGCDVCQEVCPFNHTALKRSASADLGSLRAEHGVGALLPLREVIRIKSDEEFKKKFGGTPLVRTKREGLLRNAAVVAANTCAVELLHDLINTATTDNSSVVRQHSLWSAAVLGKHSGQQALKKVREIADSLREDLDCGLREEAIGILSGEIET